MFINPTVAIEKGWVQWNDNVQDIKKYIQPNALDFDCAKIFELDEKTPAFLSEEKKIIRASTPYLPRHEPAYGEVWYLKNGTCYDFSSNFYVTIPPGVAGLLIIRSTLNRSGVFLTSGIFDAGFSGQIAGMLRIHGGVFHLAPNTRIGQIAFCKSEDSGRLYSGNYNHAQDTHWAAST